jgi:hypothetical protein
VACSQDALLARIPVGLDPVIAAALPTVGVTAMQIAESLAPLDGKIVLIVGAAGATGRCRAHHPARAGRKPKIGRSREGRRGSWRSAGYVTASAHRCRARPPHLGQEACMNDDLGTQDWPICAASVIQMPDNQRTQNRYGPKYPGVTWSCHVFTCRNDRNPGTSCVEQTGTGAMLTWVPAAGQNSSALTAAQADDTVHSIASDA